MDYPVACGERPAPKGGEVQHVWMPVSDPGPRPLSLPGGLAWPVRRDACGRTGPTPRQARGPTWRSSSYGLYVPSTTGASAEQRIVEAAAVLPAYGGVTGWAALRWCGALWLDGVRQGGREERPVTLAVGFRSIRSQPGMSTSQERLDPSELEARHGLRITTPLRSLFFEMRYAASESEAVQAADMTAYADLVSRDELATFAAVNAGWTGMDRFRKATLDMSENAWSPAEVTMRRVWQHDAGLPRPLCNHPVFDLAGRHLGTPDLLDPLAGVAGEYNGALHLEGAQRSRDVRREARFRTAGLEYVEMLAGDLADPFPFMSRLRDAYARAARIPVSERSWTTELPPWWVPTFTVAQRRALDEDQHRRLLRLRLHVS
jgi:hypothetical protein